MPSTQIVADMQPEVDNSGDQLPTGHKPVLIVISGLPGTGKSFLCRRLAERLKYTVLESDAIRKKLFPHPTYSTRESAILFRAIHYFIEELLSKNISVILDATNLIERNRKPLYKIAEKYDARLILVRTEAPLALVKKRLASRVVRRGSNKSDADWSIYQKMKASQEKISRRHFIADTSRDITPVIEKIVKEAGI